MKKRGMKKRVMAALMTACMVVGSVPGVSLADVSGEPSGTLTPAAKKHNFDGTASTEAAPDIELNKTAAYNGTFTENGQTELTKTFEVGTKLTLADIPAGITGSMLHLHLPDIHPVLWCSQVLRQVFPCRMLC